VPLEMRAYASSMSKIRNFDGGDRSDIAEPLPPLIRLLRGHIVGTAEYVTPSPRPATNTPSSYRSFRRQPGTGTGLIESEGPGRALENAKIRKQRRIVSWAMGH
jgi:hypothetical protein